MSGSRTPVPTECIHFYLRIRVYNVRCLVVSLLSSHCVIVAYAVDDSFPFFSAEEESVDYPMGVRQSATIIFPDPSEDKKWRSSEKNTGETKSLVPGRPHGIATLKFQKKKKTPRPTWTRSRRPSTTCPTISRLIRSSP